MKSNDDTPKAVRHDGPAKMRCLFTIFLLLGFMRVLAEGQQAERPVAGAERFNLSKQEIEAIVSSESPSASKCFSLYLYFEMVENNNKQAMPWLIQAAVGNDAGAQYTYGVILSERPETLNLGINWLKKSKANGYEPAGPTLERLEKKRDKLRK